MRVQMLRWPWACNFLLLGPLRTCVYMFGIAAWRRVLVYELMLTSVMREEECVLAC